MNVTDKIKYKDISLSKTSFSRVQKGYKTTVDRSRKTPSHTGANTNPSLKPY
jgi:hypothetical protein